MIHSQAATPERSVLNLYRQIDIQLRRLPDWLRRYVIVLAALIVGCGVAALLLHTVGDKARLVVSLLGDLVFLGAAWVGYGPGVLVLALIMFVVPRILVPGQPSHVNLGQFGLLAVISLLVSRISSSKRQTESSLRRWGDELERRVQERTLELQRNEQSRAWLAAMVEFRMTPLSVRPSMARLPVGIGEQKPSTGTDRTRWSVGPSQFLCPPNVPTTSLQFCCGFGTATSFKIMRPFDYIRTGGGLLCP